MEEKKCRICGKLLPLSEFYLMRKRNKYRHECRACTKAIYDWKRRGIKFTIQEYQSMMTEQNGKCKICGDPLDMARKTHLDHCHQTGKVRGILCKHCNTALGLLKDSPELFRKAAQYLEEAG